MAVESIDRSGDFEKYLRREPLTQELADLRDGKEKQSRMDTPAHEDEASIAPDEKLTKADILDLKEMLSSRGWMVMRRISRKLFQEQEKSVIADSQNKPLERAATIATNWAHLVMYKRAIDDLEKVAVSKVQELDSRSLGRKL